MAYRTEQQSLVALLGFARDNGAASFRIDDGGEWACDRTDDTAEIVAASNSTGEDSLHCYDANGARIGRFYLIWGDCPEGTDLVANYGVNAFTEATFDAWFKASEYRLTQTEN